MSHRLGSCGSGKNAMAEDVLLATAAAVTTHAASIAAPALAASVSASTVLARDTAESGKGAWGRHALPTC